MSAIDESSATSLLFSRTDPAEASRLLDALLRHIPEGITIADAPDLRIRAVSQYAYALAGRSPDDLEGLPYARMAQGLQLHHLDGETVATLDELPLARAVTRGEFVRDEEWLLRRPGGDIVIVCNAAPIRDEAGRITGGLVAWRDGTERRLMMDALLASERKARQRLAEVEAIYASAPVGLCVLDSSLRILRVNERLADMAKRPRAGLVGVTPGEAFPGLEPVLMPLLRRVLESGRPVVSEELRNADPAAPADATTYVLSALPLSGDGEEGGVNLVLEDVTRQRETERALREVHQSRVLGQLAGGLAHELNNDLAAGIGFGTLALRHIPTGHPARSAVDRSIEAQKEAAGIVRQVLAFSQRQQLRPSRVEVGAFLEQTAPLLRRALVDQQLLHLVPGPEGYFEADAAQLGEALLNVVLNARDVMGPRGTVTLRVAEAVGEIGVEVEDEGPGMEPAVLDRAFEPFFTTKDVGVGAGLGLAVVDGIVRQHRGRVVLDSAPGRGTRVRLLLPRCAPPPPPVSVAAPSEEAGRPTGSILVIDDEPLVSDSLAELLTMEGLSTLTAASGQEGLDILAREEGRNVALVICDLVMPGLNGAEVGARIAMSNPHIRLLFISGYAREDVLRSGLLPPGAPFLPKPFDFDEILRVTRALVTEPARARA